MEKPDNFEPFDLTLLKKQGGRLPSVNLSHMSRKEATITGIFHPPSLLNLNPSDLEVGSSVAVYSNVKAGRPWIGFI